MATDPSQLMYALANSAGLQGADFTQQQQQNQANRQALALGGLKLQEAQRQQQEQQNYGIDIQGYLADPTPEKLSALAMKYPDEADALKKSYAIMGDAQKTNLLTQYGSLYNAASNGRADLVKSQLTQIRRAEQAKGIDTSEIDDALAGLASGDTTQALTAVKGIAQLHIAAANPDSFAKTANIGGNADDASTVVSAGGALVRKSDGTVLYKAGEAPKYQKVDVYNDSGQKIGEKLLQVGGDETGGTSAPSGSSGAPLSVRLNNPGAIRFDPKNQWQGQVGDSGGFVQFDTPANGARAHQKLIANQIKQGFDTPASWASHYAPASDGNNPAAYASTIAKGLGIGINDPIPLSAVPKMASLSAAVERGGTPTQGAAPGPKVLYDSTGGGDPTAGGGDSGLTGDAYLATLSPTIQAKVKAVAEGRTAPPRPGTRYGETTLDMVTRYDPTFDAANAMSRVKTRVDFTSGKSAVAVNALNTAMGHLIHLDDQAHDLGNFSVAPGVLNPIYNSIRKNVGGNTSITAFDQTKQAAASEMRKVFTGASGGSLAELEGWEKTLNSSQSYPQLHEVIKNGVELMGSRLSALQDQYATGMGRSDKIPQMIKPSLARQANQLFGIDLGDSTPAKPQGNQQSKPTRTATNPRTGQRIGLVNGRWVPIQ